MINQSIQENEKVKRLHQTVIEVTKQVKVIIKNHKNPEEEKLSFAEKFSDTVFNFGSSWTPILLFTSVVILWVIYNVTVSAPYRFDPYPFLLMTFLLAGTASIQAPFIMMSQHHQSQKNSKRLALNLKVENEVLTLYQSITVLMEQQLQQVLENQTVTLKLLQDIHLKFDQKKEPIANDIVVK